ncbi:unnamed protein product [Timema podura]|uniref:Uncharacterized protein n=1 Tax=Timema podura TaxID=61482 RepID=A0ABN7NS19_TIMPD|nr:unnamed protein product [Timema podura]
MVDSEWSVTLFAALAGLGCALLVWLLADSVWALFYGIRVHLMPYITPQPVNLTDMFGTWAGTAVAAWSSATLAVDYTTDDGKIEIRISGGFLRGLRPHEPPRLILFKVCSMEPLGSTIVILGSMR